MPDKGPHQESTEILFVFLTDCHVTFMVGASGGEVETKAAKPNPLIRRPGADQSILCQDAEILHVQYFGPTHPALAPFQLPAAALEAMKEARPMASMHAHEKTSR